jgi:hypothetical protein
MPHYKNGRLAKNGDAVVLLPEPRKNFKPVAGYLHGLQEGTTCNAQIEGSGVYSTCVTVSQCLHADDISAASIPDSSVPDFKEPNPMNTDAAPSQVECPTCSREPDSEPTRQS